MSTSVLVTGCHQPSGHSLARLAALLPDVRLWLAGTPDQHCDALCDTIRQDSPECHVHSVPPEDCLSPASMLTVSGAKLVLHAEGPFTQYAYQMAEACLAAGIPYIDAADRRAFMASFTGALHPLALKAGVPLICGGSTSSLGSALLDEIAPQFNHIRDVRVTVIPGVRSLRPGSQLATLLSTVGRPMTVLRNGQKIREMSGRHLRKLSVPSVGRCSSVLCDMPDNETLPPRFPDLETLETRLALPGFMAPRAVWLLSHLRQGMQEERIPHPRGGQRPLTAAEQARLRRGQRTMPWLLKRLAHGTSHAGGLIVEAHGDDSMGRPLTRVSSLIASAPEAAYLPILPVIALARQCLEDRASLLPGAYTTPGLLPLRSYMAESKLVQLLLEREARRTQTVPATIGNETPSKRPVPQTQRTPAAV